MNLRIKRSTLIYAFIIFGYILLAFLLITQHRTGDRYTNYLDQLARPVYIDTHFFLAENRYKVQLFQPVVIDYVDTGDVRYIVVQYPDFYKRVKSANLFHSGMIDGRQVREKFHPFSDEANELSFSEIRRKFPVGTQVNVAYLATVDSTIDFDFSQPGMEYLRSFTPLEPYARDFDQYKYLAGPLILVDITDELRAN